MIFCDNEDKNLYQKVQIYNFFVFNVQIIYLLVYLCNNSFLIFEFSFLL